MFVAVCDQFFGTSTSSWRKMVTPFSFPISAVRFSHSTASNGEIFPSVKYLSKARPCCAPVFSGVVSVIGEFRVNACFTVAILPLRNLELPISRGTPNFTPRQPQGAGRILKITAAQNFLFVRHRRKRRLLGSRPFPGPPGGPP